eukprot:765782-Hanusia_phi.AAC.7
MEAGSLYFGASKCSGSNGFGTRPCCSGASADEQATRRGGGKAAESSSEGCMSQRAQHERRAGNTGSSHQLAVSKASQGRLS